MTDPVREKMRHILKSFEREYEDSGDMFAVLQRIRRNTITDLLRVIRGHTYRRVFADGKVLICDTKLIRAFVSLPEEVKK